MGDAKREYDYNEIAPPPYTGKEERNQAKRKGLEEDMERKRQGDGWNLGRNPLQRRVEGQGFQCSPFQDILSAHVREKCPERVKG